MTVTADTPPAKPSQRKRLDHVDAMRPVKQAGVVSTHTLLAFAPLAGLAVGSSLVLLHVTREAFLFVSSCMLTYSYYNLRRDGLRHFWWRRFVAVGIPYLCWTLLYFLLTIGSFSSSPATALGHLGYLTVSGYYQLYYLLVIMQFYVVFPLLLVLLRKTAGRHVTLLLASLAVQLAIVGVMHWGLLPPWMEGFWATRDIISYQFYLIAGAVVALHLDQVHQWLCGHAWRVVIGTVAAALAAEGWYLLAATHHAAWLGSGSDPLQPIDIPYNVGAIACIYLIGVALVDPRRSARIRRMTTSGSDNSYGVYLAQMVFITILGWLGWKSLRNVVPWPILCVVTVAIVFLACVALTAVLARTPLAGPLTGRKRQRWPWATGRPAATGAPPEPLPAGSPLELDPDPERAPASASASMAGSR